MNLTLFAEERKVALAKWHEYAQAYKKTKDPVYRDLRNVYREIKNKSVIDITKTLINGGTHPDHRPTLAIARATSKKAMCVCSQNGSVRYTIDFRGRRDVILPAGSFPSFTFSDNNKWRSLNLEAPTPIIPPQLRPSKLDDKHYILWEVDEWKMIAPTDPFLLRRITKTIFVVLAGWDLTDLEKAIMQERLTT